MGYRYPFSGTPYRNLLSQGDIIYPMESVAAPVLEAFAPLAPFGGNDGHPTDAYDSLEQQIVSENAKALFFAMFGSELEADSVDPGGHEHQGGEQEIEWLSVWQSNFISGVSAFPDNSGVFWNSTAFKDLGYAVVTLGEFSKEGQTFLYFRARGAAPAFSSGTLPDLDLRIRVFRTPFAGSKEIDTQIGSNLILKLPLGTVNQWVTAPVFDLGSELVALPDNQGFHLIYLRFEIRASINPGAVTLYEIQVGRLGGK